MATGKWKAAQGCAQNSYDFYRAEAARLRTEARVMIFTRAVESMGSAWTYVRVLLKRWASTIGFVKQQQSKLL